MFVVLPVLPDPQGRPEQQGQQVLKVRKVFREPLEQPVPLVQLVLPVLLVRKALRV